jgi:hypothetical protein
MQDEDMQSCESCAWFGVNYGAEIGECHRFPPAAGGQFPSVSKRNICGEYANRRTGKSFIPARSTATDARLSILEEEVDRLKRLASWDK